MRKFYKKRLQKVGAPPGALIPVYEKKDYDPTILILSYNKTSFKESKIKDLKQITIFLDNSNVNWINLNGVHRIEPIEQLGNIFNIHSLVLEDILNTDQRPKIEDFEDNLFIVLKMLYYSENRIDSEQISLIFGKHFVVSFQETEKKIFTPIKERIRTDKGRIRRMGTDYLAYTIIDFIIDNYFTILEAIQEKMDILDNELVENPSQRTMQELQKLKRTLLFIRKSVWPLREVVGNLLRQETPLITESIHIFLRDLNDHVIQIIDMIETYRELLSGMHDIYLSNISNRMNEIMKTLTIIATIFIPLTFIAGLYGMNFQYMPEIMWIWGYPLVLFSMLTIGIIMLIYFKKKKWI